MVDDIVFANAERYKPILKLNLLLCNPSLTINSLLYHLYVIPVTKLSTTVYRQKCANLDLGFICAVWMMVDLNIAYLCHAAG